MNLTKENKIKLVEAEMDRFTAKGILPPTQLGFYQCGRKNSNIARISILLSMRYLRLEKFGPGGKDIWNPIFSKGNWRDNIDTILSHWDFAERITDPDDIALIFFEISYFEALFDLSYNGRSIYDPDKFKGVIEDEEEVE